MSRKQGVKQWIGKGLTVVLFSWYYVFLGTTAWLLITPDVAGALREVELHDVWSALFCWGAVASLYLSIRGAVRAVEPMPSCMKRRDWNAVLQQGVNAVCCSSLMIAPIYALQYNMAIKTADHPTLVIALVGLFALIATNHYLRVMDRAPGASTEMAHA